MKLPWDKTPIKKVKYPDKMGTLFRTRRICDLES